MEISSNFDINDSELLRIEKGPVAWAHLRAGHSMNIDQFVKGFEEQMNEIGFTVEMKVFDTNQSGAYAFACEIIGRTRDSQFDPDKMVYEVVNNILELPGQDKGFIKSEDGAKALAERSAPKGTGKHKH